MGGFDRLAVSGFFHEMALRASGLEPGGGFNLLLNFGPTSFMNTGERAMHDRIFGGTPYEQEELKQEHANALKGEYPDPQDGEATCGAGLGTWSDPFEDAGLYQ